MPARNIIKVYAEDSYYHVYNRGVEKRAIFLDQQDYAVFLSYLKDYLLPKDEESLRNRLTDLSTSYKDRDKILRLLRLNNFHNEITLISYCLMPNHFHFFLHQNNATSIDKFAQSLFTRYTMYFNKKYKRVGSLFQAVYKAALVNNDIQFIYLSKYIHKQSLASKGETLQGCQKQPSSLSEYLRSKETAWVHPEKVLELFSKTNPNLSYQKFLDIDQPEYSLTIQNIILE